MKKKNLKLLMLSKESISKLNGGIGDPPPVTHGSFECPIPPYKASLHSFCVYSDGPCWTIGG